MSAIRDDGYLRVHQHSPVEVMDLRDASALVRLILAVARRY